MDSKKKNLLIVLGVAGVAAYLIYKNIRKKAQEKAAAELGTLVGSFPTTNPNNTNPNPTITPPADLTKYRSIANDLFVAMSGCGTDWGGITGAIAKIKSEADWKGVVSAYGTKTISSEWWCIGNSDYSGGLVGALQDELSSGEINEINQMLSQNGVTSKI